MTREAVVDLRRGGTMGPEGFLFELTGGHLALDLANTLDERRKPRQRELLHSCADLLNWARQVSIIDRERELKLLRKAKRDRPGAESLFKEALELRETLFVIFSAVAEETPIPPGKLLRLNRFLSEALPHRRLRPDGAAAEWEWTTPENDLRQVLRPVLLAASELLVSPERSRVRLCEGPGCRWLFLDHSRKGNRRWCDMSICGNRVKARRHYEKTRRV